MQRIAARLKQNAWTQAEAASRCGVTQPRIDDLLRGRVSRFSLDALVNMATALGWRVRVDVEAAASTPPDRRYRGRSSLTL
jgi:predicted XRE-type DNA-binding protein